MKFEDRGLSLTKRKKRKKKKKKTMDFSIGEGVLCTPQF
jgi:hypothetical protein